jgi:hypothetical protein
MPHRTPRLLFATLALFVIFLGGLSAPLPLPAQPARDKLLFLPLAGGGSGPTPVFGIEMLRLDAARGIDLVTTSGTRWVRRNGLLWKQVEPTQGAGYSWDHPDIKELELEMVRASQLGISLVLIVRGSPSWATAPHAAGCAPINPSHYASFARFMAAAVERYSKPPYNVRYWELGNEPDAPIRPDDFVFGCWGVTNDPYYGGEAYGQMLKSVVPAMKAVNPHIAVLNGGLLLDRPFKEGDSTTTLGRFFEGVLRGGGGPHIDLVSFHTYVFYRTPGQPELGPREDWRVNYLRGLMRKYSVPERPLIRTETALLCPVITVECRWAQADLVGRTYARTVRDGVLASIWYVYDNDSFHNTAMIEPSDVWVPRPAYFAYRHTARMLGNSSYSGPIPGLDAAAEGYVFNRGSEQIYIYWSDEKAGVPISLPIPEGSSVTCTDRDGGPQPCAPTAGALQLTAQVSPAFVVVKP